MVQGAPWFLQLRSRLIFGIRRLEAATDPTAAAAAAAAAAAQPTPSEVAAFLVERGFAPWTAAAPSAALQELDFLATELQLQRMLARLATYLPETEGSLPAGPLNRPPARPPARAAER